MANDLQLANTARKEKAALFKRAAASFEACWHEHEQAKAHELDLFELAWNERDRPKRSKTMQDLATRARAFAVQAHGDQQRKYEQCPTSST